MQDYILGSIRGTVTAILLGEYDQPFGYTPETATDPLWSNMASVGAKFELMLRK
jgi:hypothetical protein